MKIDYSSVSSNANRNYSKSYRNGVMKGAAFGGYVESHEEKEETNYSSDGTIKTEDGRTINVNLKLEMERSKRVDTFIRTGSPLDSLCDPLIINIDANTAHLSDSKFKFDLDGDGKLDEISSLGQGSGFLALDKNNDGRINDGNELFGTKSGDGFKDLSEYDIDGNGWIDENDDIFYELKVWYKDDRGVDRLIDLKEAGVGAIYLGAQSTEFTLEGEDEQLDGKIRKTGFFLKENGQAGTIQHVDLAIKGNEREILSVDEQMEQIFENIRKNRSSTGAKKSGHNNKIKEEARRRAEKAAKRKEDLKNYYEKQANYRKMIREWQEKEIN